MVQAVPELKVTLMSQAFQELLIQVMAAAPAHMVLVEAAPAAPVVVV
jgi:hypothetical protein